MAANITSVHDIIGETDRLSALVGQMLTLASADAGQEPEAAGYNRISQ